MKLTSLINKIYPQPGFVYESCVEEQKKNSKILVFLMRPRKSSKGTCSNCGKKGPTHDTLDERGFQFIPLWGFSVFLRYAPRRIRCDQCGVKIENMPWSDGKSPNTTAFLWFLSFWAQFLSWKDTAKTFGVSWHVVFNAVEMAVKWGLDNRKLDGIDAIGMDEIARSKGHKYLTLFYQIGESGARLLHIARDRREASVRTFFDMLGDARSSMIKFVCTDMWKPFISVIRDRIPNAIHVLDRFHISQHMSRAIDKVRAEEVKRLASKGREPVLKRARWILLKRKKNLSKPQRSHLRRLVKINLKSVKAYLLKEELVRFWNYKSLTWARRFLKGWIRTVNRSKLEPIKSVAKMIQNHEELIMNWFKAKGQISNATAEGFNCKARVITKRAYGFRTERALEVALYHQLGKLPSREFSHRFW